MFPWLPGSPKLKARLQEAFSGTRVLYSRYANGNGPIPVVMPNTTFYLLIVIVVLMLFLCVGLSAFFFTWQGDSDRGLAAFATPTAFVSVPEVVEVIVIATPTVSATLTVPTAVPTLVRPPMTCADIQTINPEATDGEYTLYLNRNVSYPATIYCHNMIGRPFEYLSLVNISDSANFASTAYPGDTLITRYAKVRLDVHHLTLNPTDRTFATISGSVPLYSRVPYNDYGRAVGCNESQPGSAFGRANIDLTGTNFALDDTVTFSLGGAEAEGSGAQITQDGQIVNLEASGHCGWVEADGALQLKYVPLVTE